MLRDKATKIDVNGGTGGIIRTCVINQELMIYKLDKTFKAQTPNELNRLNPDMPWLITEHSDIGTSHPVLTRLVIQS